MSREKEKKNPLLNQARYSWRMAVQNVEGPKKLENFQLK